MLKKILITGSQGYLGKNLSSYLKKYDVFGIDIVDAKDKKYDQIDITNKKEMSKIINQIKPDVIIHTAALHNLKVCELEPKKSDQINYQPIEDMVEIINKSKLDTHFIFISSDYVFKGDTGHYNESDKTNPQTVYGKDKVKAENIIIKKLEKYSIIRTAAIFGRGGNNFFNFIVSSLKNNEVIDVYNDTFFTPTYPPF